ncbi:MAG TPA: cell wall-binding repeat-containing protein [Acidimicrobiales bacterium]|nr:cell wall-binding repeat-containing protein [Acidimicrobiales bacterium]
MRTEEGMQMTGTKTTRRRVVAAALAATAATATGGTAWATAGVTSQRLAGSDRYGTAQTVATRAFPSGATTVVLTSGTDFPDALVASYLAGRLHGPTLLTDRDVLPSATGSALQALKATSVVIVGGPAAVSKAVQTQLTNAGYQVSRVYGNDRYSTAASIATLFPPSFVGSLNATSGPTAIVATGATFADVLAGGPLSYRASFPMLLTDPTSLSSSTSSALTSLGIKQVLLLGGTAAVSQNVQNQIAGKGITVTRLAGQDRAGTAAQVATLAEAQLGWTLSHVDIARGDDFADALAGVDHAGNEAQPILLTASPTALDTYTSAYLQDHASTIASMDVFGGTGAVSDGVVTQARQAAGGS